MHTHTHTLKQRDSHSPTQSQRESETHTETKRQTVREISTDSRQTQHIITFSLDIQTQKQADCKTIMERNLASTCEHANNVSQQ